MFSKTEKRARSIIVALVSMFLVAGVATTIIANNEAANNDANAALGFGAAAGGAGSGGRGKDHHDYHWVGDDNYSAANFNPQASIDKFRSKFPRTITPSSAPKGNAKYVSSANFALASADAINGTSGKSRVIGAFYSWNNSFRSFWGPNRNSFSSWIASFPTSQLTGLNGYPESVKRQIISGAASAAGNGTSLVVISINIKDLEKWKVVTETRTDKKYDSAAKTTATKMPIQNCAAMYQTTATGTDGYVFGQSVKGKTTTTKFGELYNKLLSQAKSGTGYYKTTHNQAEADKIRDELMAEATKACNTTKTTTYEGVNIAKDSAFYTNYKKGGIALFAKFKKDVTINYQNTNTEYSIRAVDYHMKKQHVEKCGNPNDRGCNYTSESSARSHITCPNWCVASTQYRGSWNSSEKGTGWPGRQFTGTYYCAAPNSTNMSKKATKADYNVGCWSEVEKTVKPHVPDELGSWYHVLHYYTMNILCDQNDFKAYKSHVAAWIASDNSVAGGMNKFQGSLVSKASTDTSSINGTKTEGDNVTLDIGSVNADVMFPAVSQNLGAAQIGITPVEFATLRGSYFGGATLDTKTGTYKTVGSYKAENDPVYTKECPWDCTSDITGSAAKANGAANNVTRDKNHDGKQDNKSGVAVNPSDDKGNLTNKITNSSEMTFFRNNAWNNFTTDLWYPKSGNGVTYNGEKATTTTIKRDVTGTPTVSNYKFQTASGDTVFKNTSGVQINGQSSPLAAATGEGGVSTIKENGQDKNVSTVSVLAGQQTKFRIRAPWASDANKPLRFNIKWEYNVTNTTLVPTSSNGVGDAMSIGFSTATTTSDGKCDGTYSNNYRDMTNLNHDNTGNPSENKLDDGFKDEADRYFQIYFVRSTAE